MLYNIYSLDDYSDVSVSRKVDGGLHVLCASGIHDVCRESPLGTVSFSTETGRARGSLSPFRELRQGVIDPEIYN